MQSRGWQHVAPCKRAQACGCTCKQAWSKLCLPHFTRWLPINRLPQKKKAEAEAAGEAAPAAEAAEAGSSDTAAAEAEVKEILAEATAAAAKEEQQEKAEEAASSSGIKVGAGLWAGPAAAVAHKQPSRR